MHTAISALTSTRPTICYRDIEFEPDKSGEELFTVHIGPARGHIIKMVGDRKSRPIVINLGMGISFKD